MFNSEIFCKIHIVSGFITNTIKRASTDLVFSEFYSLGSFLTLSGLPEEGIPYYDLALEKATKEEDKLVIYREIGNARGSQGPFHNLDIARDAYLKAIIIASTSAFMLPVYAVDLTELGGVELSSGDWKCGKELTDVGLDLLEVATRAGNPIAASNIGNLSQFIAAQSQKQAQAATGCPYKAPVMSEESIQMWKAIQVPPSAVSSVGSQSPLSAAP